MIGALCEEHLVHIGQLFSIYPPLMCMKNAFKLDYNPVDQHEIAHETAFLPLIILCCAILGLKEFNDYTSSNGCSSNPFLNDNVKTRSILDVAVEKLTTITCKKSQCK